MPNTTQEYKLEAAYIAKEINLAKTAEKLDKNLIGRRREFLTYLLGAHEFLFVFSFGAVAFVNVARETQVSIRRSLSRFLVNPTKKIYDESYVLREEEGAPNIGDDVARLPSIGIEEVEVASRILAQSVALEYIEDLTEDVLNNIGTIQSELQKTTFVFYNSRPIFRIVSENSNIMQFVISKLSLLDKPDVAWEHRNLELLFSQLADLFELRPRFRNIEYKIAFARSNSEFALTILHGQRSNLLEVIIILLFVFDILIYLFGG